MSAARQDFPAAAHAALGNAALQSSLTNLKQGFQKKRAEAMAALPDATGLRDAGASIRQESLARLPELLETFEARVTGSGGHVHWASDAAEARDIITRLLKDRGVKTVTKGKSMVTEEIALNAHLERENIIPIETDLGEYIIQLRHEPPSHIVAPAFHLRRQDVEESFRGAHADLDSSRSLNERSALVAEARGVMRRHFHAADAGITGANFLVAETGTAIVVTNEGNGDLTRLLPRLHIVVTGIEKIVPTLADAAVLLRLLTRAATGQEITSYVTFSSAARGEHDADGPSEFHVVLVDNGRSKLLASPVWDVLKCIRCGACLNHCPVYGAVGGHAYGAVYPGPIGAALNPALEGVAKHAHLPQASSFCGRCDEVCPVKVPLTRTMRHWRNEAFAQNTGSPSLAMGLRLWGFLAERRGLYGVVSGFARIVLRLAAGRHANISNMPVMRGWFAVRDLARPARKSFQSQWRAQKGKPQ